MDDISILYEIQVFYFQSIFNDTLFYLYLVTVLVDIITGNLAALYVRRWNSKIGLNGTLRHMALFTVVIFLLPMISFTTNMLILSNGVLLYVITQYTISIIENIRILGVDLGDAFSKYFDYLKEGNHDKKQDDKEHKRKGVGHDES